MPEVVSVNAFYDGNTRKFIPTHVLWKQQTYKLTKLGLYYTFKKGSKVFHVFSSASDTKNFKLVFDSSGLNWSLEAMYDAALD